jgi:hypothetical protein
MLKKSGALRALSRMGKVGKGLAKVAKFAPYVAVALDEGIAVYDIRTSRKRLEEARNREERRIQEAAEREKARRTLLVQQLTRAGRDAMECVGDQVLAAVGQILLTRRCAVQRRVEDAANADKAARTRLASLNRAISEGERFLEFARREAVGV